MVERRPAAGPALAAYRAEVLRWNSQINLVSRQDTGRRLDALILQCERAFEALADAHPGIAAGSVLYCDLGSGGGLPGFVWHQRLAAAARGPVESWLVEPREKRAWFLERVARLAAPRAYGVLAGRWGEVVAPARDAAETALISLKALRLRDLDVLEGLAALRQGSGPPPRVVVIARFHPPDETWTPQLAADLGVVPAGDSLGPWRGAGADILPVAGAQAASLVVCRYVRDGA